MVFGRFHLFAFARPFVVDAAQVEHAVHHDPLELLAIGDTIFLCVGAHRVEADEDVAADGVTLAVVEGDDVGVVVVFQELAIDLQYFFIVTKDISQVADLFLLAEGHTA